MNIKGVILKDGREFCGNLVSETDCEDDVFEPKVYRFKNLTSPTLLPTQTGFTIELLPMVLSNQETQLEFSDDEIRKIVDPEPKVLERYELLFGEQNNDPQIIQPTDADIAQSNLTKRK